MMYGMLTTEMIEKLRDLQAHIALPALLAAQEDPAAMQTLVDRTGGLMKPEHFKRILRDALRRAG